MKYSFRTWSDYRRKYYNYGDIMKLGDSDRSSDMVFIGKDGKLIDNDDEYLHVPYEITQYLTDAMEIYGDDRDIKSIALRYDDKYILENINTPTCKLQDSWGLDIVYMDYGLYITDEDNNSGYFKNADEIKKWYDDPDNYVEPCTK